MNDLMQVIGTRLRGYRTQRTLSQERLAEMAGVHPTYIGQIERGEKNITLESLLKITTALEISPSRLLEKLGVEAALENYPLRCYELIAGCRLDEQKQLHQIISEILALRLL